MNALYNEIEPFAADWLERLIADGHIASGAVDRRSIADLSPGDVAGPGQRHFFAGIGGWSYALRLAGVPDDVSVWTGSCPCQPFSSAGKGLGVRDPRHLWPAWFALIRECRPAIIFGEQVASRDGLAWLDLVFADLERCGYAVGTADLCAAGVGAPHIRQRLYFAAYADEAGRGELGKLRIRGDRDASCRDDVDRCGTDVELADHERERLEGREQAGAAKRPIVGPGDRAVADPSVARLPRTEARGERGGRPGTGTGCGLGHSDSQPGRRDSGAVSRAQGADSSMRSRVDGPWTTGVLVDCADGNRRSIPTEPEFFPLAHGVPARVGRLRGYGNAIVPQVAATFIRCALEAKGLV